jgi:hypothetical protein
MAEIAVVSISRFIPIDEVIEVKEPETLPSSY